MDAAPSSETVTPPQDATMAKREIELPDGRYMVFYTFDAEGEHP